MHSAPNGPISPFPSHIYFCKELMRCFYFLYSHLLIVFGGLHGLEAALESDESLPETDPSLLFDHYVNTCPYQGSRTIRTEVRETSILNVYREIIERFRNPFFIFHLSLFYFGFPFNLLCVFKQKIVKCYLKKVPA